MNINRYNYEEFFLLYVDNELTKEERAEVETFVQENPDLEEELLMLKQSSLRPDMNIHFPGKSSLMKPEAAGLVNETNYEEFFLLYVDDELETILRKEVEQFAASKPQYQTELNLLLQTRIEPQTSIVFPDKSLLYKEESERKPVVIVWWRVAAIAAMLLIALGIFWINNREQTVPGTIAVNEKQNDQPAVTNQAPQTINKEEAQDEKMATVDRKEPVNNHEFAGTKKVERKDNIAPKGTEENIQQQLAMNTTVPEPVVDNAIQPEATNNVARVDYSQNISTTLEKANVNNRVRVMAAANVLPNVSDEPDDAETSDKEDIYFANTTVDRKNKLRGLFRKVTRVFEKTTNLPAIEEKGILIGNFEIALK